MTNNNYEKALEVSIEKLQKKLETTERLLDETTDKLNKLKLLESNLYTKIPGTTYNHYGKDSTGAVIVSCVSPIGYEDTKQWVKKHGIEKVVPYIVYDEEGNWTLGVSINHK